ncbi:MAG: type IVB secretion system protein DotA [Candidatus Aquirickettsiella sp.]
MKKFLLTGLLYLFPSLLLADTLSLTPPSTDLSMSYLATIFGVVDGVLHGTGSQILGTMFGAFNAIILVMASIILTYVLFISILNTSHEGEFLGKKWSSIWVPLRTVMGVGLLLPKATGYSFIQIMVMWVVVQGIGAADEVWNVALNYMNRNGTIVEPIQSLDPKSGSGANNTFLISKAGNILKSEVCMLTVNNALVKQYSNPKDPANKVLVPNFLTTLTVTGKGPGGQNTGKPIDYTKDIGGFITFPGQLPGTFANLKGMCGSVSWDFIGKADNGQVANPEQLTANDSASIAARQMTLDLSSSAQGLANKLVPPSTTQTTPLVLLKLSDFDFSNNPSTQGHFNLSNNLVDTAEDYFGIVKPALRSLDDAASKQYKEFITKAKDSGWILAGSYYYNMARLNQSIRNNTGSLALQDKITPIFSPEYDGSGFNTISDSNVILNLKNNLPVNGGVFDQYISTEIAQAGKSDNPGPEADPSFPKNSAEDGLGKAASWIMGVIFPRVYDFESSFADNLNNKNMDPIFALASLGNGLVKMVETIWISILGAAFTGGILSAVASIFFPGPAIIANMLVMVVIFLVMPLVTVWMIVNLVLGSLLSYYVPLIPFFLFAFGSITWFAVVLEAILAAPLVALGITHPEGHDFLGKAEQSVMLLASVFLRPMLMVFGFIFGIILSYVAISVFNRGFSIASQYLTEYNGDIFSIVYQLAMMAIYTAAILAIVNRSFAMIYEVPNKVLRWIGGPQESGHEESMLQGIRSQHDRDIGQIAQQAPTGQTFNDAFTTGQQAGKAASGGNQTSASSSGGGDDGGGGGGAPPAAPGGGGAAAGSGGAAGGGVPPEAAALL